jgi:hypothetical protein
MNPLPTTYTLGQRTSEFVGALQSLPIHSKEHEQIAHKMLNKIHAPALLHTKTPAELTALYRSMLTQAGVDADCVGQFTAKAEQLNLFRDVETLEDLVTPWVEPQS